MDIQAVCFDMDGTLIDTERYYRICWPRAVASFGCEMTDEQALIMRSLGRPFAARQLQEWFGDKLEYQLVRAKRQELMEEYLKKEGIRCKPGALVLLRALKERQIITAVVTATDLGRAERYLRETGLYGYFDRLVSARQVPEGKPSPHVYRYACQQLGIEPQDCVAVEDAPNGVMSAYQAGCKVIMVPDQTQPDEKLCRCLYAKADSLEEIPGILDGPDKGDMGSQ